MGGWEHPDGEAKEDIGYLEGVLGIDFRTEVKFDHYVYGGGSSTVNLNYSLSRGVAGFYSFFSGLGISLPKCSQVHNSHSV